MKIEKNVRIPMRDGVHLAADIYRPAADGKVPALLALSPYGKELQALALTMPPQARPSPLWDGGIEAGDIRAVVEHGYAHVIADVRGTEPPVTCTWNARARMGQSGPFGHPVWPAERFVVRSSLTPRSWNSRASTRCTIVAPT